jgi:glucose-1-phosphate cytidylyltransferase
MKAVILAGGRGKRLGAQENGTLKPLTDIGGSPLLFRVMEIFYTQGVDEIIVALGFRASDLLESLEREIPWKRDSFKHDRPGLASGDLEIPRSGVVRVAFADTGPETATAGRLRRLAPLVGPEGTFFMTYCDGLANVDLGSLLKWHHAHGKLATVTAVRPPERFGILELQGDSVVSFREKPLEDHRWINGGYFALEGAVLDLIPGDDTSWERNTLAELARTGQLMARRHEGFWACLDTHKDREELERILRESETPPWLSLEMGVTTR